LCEESTSNPTISNSNSSIMKEALKKGLRIPKHISLKNGLGGVYPLDINFSVDQLTTTGGVLTGLTNGSVLSSSPDYGSLQQLFDTVRCISCTIRYAPRSGGSAIVSSGTTTMVHVPYIICGDDDAVSQLSFVTLSQRDFADPRNKFTHTSKEWRHVVKFKPTLNFNGSNAVLSNLANWQDPGNMSHSTGGVLFATRTDTLNNAQILGTLLFSFHTEWSTRL